MTATRRLLPVLMLLALLAQACGADSTTSEAATSPAAGAAGPSDAGEAPAADGEPYVIGFNGGLTGSVSAFPVSALDGMRGYFEQLNASGGIDGHPVEIEARDDTGLDAARANANFVELRDAHEPPVIAGFTVSSVAEPIAPLAEESQIPITVISATEELLENPYVYGVDMLFSQDVVVEVQFLETLIADGETPRIALFGAESASGEALRVTARQLIEERGWELVLDEPLAVPAPDDMSAQAAQIVQADADYVIGGIYGQIPALLMRSLVQQGWEGQVVNFHGGSSLALLQQINDPDYYVVRSFKYSTADAPGIQELVEAVGAGGGDPDGEYVSLGWVNAALIAAGLEACGFPCPGAEMKEALDGIGDIGDVDGVAVGGVGFTPENPQAITKAQIYHFENGAVTAASDVLDAPSPFAP